jgi:hypothetical protein
MLKKVVYGIVAGSLMLAAQFASAADTTQSTTYLPAPYNTGTTYFGD